MARSRADSVVYSQLSSLIEEPGHPSQKSSRPPCPSAMKSVWGKQSQISIDDPNERYENFYYATHTLRVGSIIRVRDYSETKLQTNERNKNNVSQSALGPVFGKYRKYVVIAVFDDHVVGLPIFTCEGTGLKRKRNKEEFIAIRDIEAKDTAQPGESSHGLIWSQRFPAFLAPEVTEWYEMSNTTNVWITYPVAVRPTQHKCTVFGYLDTLSLTKLQLLHMKFMKAKVVSTNSADAQPPKPLAHQLQLNGQRKTPVRVLRNKGTSQKTAVKMNGA